MNERYPKHRKSLLLASIALLALLAGAAAGWISERLSEPQPPQLQAATALGKQPKPLPAFSLVDDTGKAFDNDRLAGRWSFLFFGYTHCPDICPATLSTLDAAIQSIADQGGAQDTQVVFVSVDPQRDTPEKLKEYVNYFNPKFVGVTGKQAALERLTRALGILHMRVPNPNSRGAYLVDHSASILLINPEGKLVALYGAPYKARWLASDFQKLRDYYNTS
jgi:protein SCO1